MTHCDGGHKIKGLDFIYKRLPLYYVIYIYMYVSILSLINEMYMEKAIMSMLQLLTCVQFIGFLGISASVFGCSMSFWPCFICRRVHFLCLHLRRVPHRDRVCLHLTTLQTSILPSFLQLNATVTIAPNFSTFTLVISIF